MKPRIITEFMAVYLDEDLKTATIHCSTLANALTMGNLGDVNNECCVHERQRKANGGAWCTVRRYNHEGQEYDEPGGNH